MSKHTPGPWVTDATLPGRVYSSDATGSVVASCVGFAYAPRPTEESNANAALIAAAPDLLAALRELSALWNSRPIREERLAEATAKASTAIAKAKGLG